MPLPFIIGEPHPRQQLISDPMDPPQHEPFIRKYKNYISILSKLYIVDKKILLNRVDIYNHNAMVKKGPFTRRLSCDTYSRFCYP